MIRVSSIEGHRLWAPLYDGGVNPLLTLEARLLDGILGPVAGLCVLDIACGTGRWAQRLARRGARVFGIDACGPMLREAAGKPPLGGRVALADAGALPFPAGAAGLTLCSFAIGYIRDAAGAVREMARVTAPGGMVALTDFHPSAAAAGWTRSFRAAGEVYEIEHITRMGGQLRREGARAGLEFAIEIDGRFGEPERPLFAAAGRGGAFAGAMDIPAVWIGIWTKP